jgi:hypothetical protein
MVATWVWHPFSGINIFDNKDAYMIKNINKLWCDNFVMPTHLLMLVKMVILVAHDDAINHVSFLKGCFLTINYDKNKHFWIQIRNILI